MNPIIAISLCLLNLSIHVICLRGNSAISSGSRRSLQSSHTSCFSISAKRRAREFASRGLPDDRRAGKKDRKKRVSVGLCYVLFMTALPVNGGMQIPSAPLASHNWCQYWYDPPSLSMVLGVKLDRSRRREKTPIFHVLSRSQNF